MSYQPVRMLEDWTPPAPIVMPVPGTTYLAQVPPPATSGWGKKLMIVIVVLVGALILLAVLSALFSGKKKRVERNPVKRLSTPELAKQLYDRLDRRGDANPATMRSLAAYTRKRTAT